MFPTLSRMVLQYASFMANNNSRAAYYLFLACFEGNLPYWFHQVLGWYFAVVAAGVGGHFGSAHPAQSGPQREHSVRAAGRGVKGGVLWAGCSDPRARRRRPLLEAACSPPPAAPWAPPPSSAPPRPRRTPPRAPRARLAPSHE
ncbi:unnamed protein product [Prorocentrum cordatum]|uniref:Uncharacterized protein n=1 Tax=Prorocentrum cordatum TaxID=2364126 RepID=A0ABN9U448_9DINO|nr:unnamed protein product [Polarella glacialis]